MKRFSSGINSSRRDLLQYAGLAGVVGFVGFTGLKFGSEPAIAAPSGTPRIVDGTSPGERPVSPYDIEYQNLDTSSPIEIKYIFTDSTSTQSTSTHSVSLSGETASGTVSTGSHSVTVPSGDIQLGIEVSHPSLSNTLSTSNGPLTTVSAEATISDDGATVSDIFSGETFAGSKSVSSYDINYNGLNTGSQITITYIFTDSGGSTSADNYTVSLSGKSNSDTVSTGNHSISVPEGTLDLDIELSHASLESPEITNVGSVGEVYPRIVDATGGTTVVDKTIGGQDYRIHAFENVGSDTFTVNRAPSGATVDVLIVGGGGGGGANDAGGGGAGGLIERTLTTNSGNYSIIVGGGGKGDESRNGDGQSGNDSIAFGLTALGGGEGVKQERTGGSGGSGGGGGHPYSGKGQALQPTSSDSGFGNDGGRGEWRSEPYPGGGGGGAGSEGLSPSNSSQRGDGGDGLFFGDKYSNDFGENGFFAGGGGGGSHGDPPSEGGQGGGGNGGTGDSGVDTHVQDGQSNTGGGGGGSGENNIQGGGDGGSGVVLIRYEI